MGDQGLGDDLYGMSRQMQADPGMGTSVSPDQRFNITDFSPEWAHASEGAKVLVMGEFLGTMQMLLISNGAACLGMLRFLQKS